MFNEDDDEEKEEKETGKEEREVADEYEAEDTHVDNIMQPETALKVSDVKKTLLNDIKEIIAVCNKERSQVVDIARVVIESKENKEAENFSTMFMVQSVIREKILHQESGCSVKLVKYKSMLTVLNTILCQQCLGGFSVKLLVI